MASGGRSCMEISDAIKPEDNFCGDRFSTLPDALAYRILSFVDVVDFKSLIEVSERWSRLCFSAPYLSMGNNTFTPDFPYRADFLDQYFSDRGKAGARIEQLRIAWSFLQAVPLGYGYGYGRGKRKRERDCDNGDAVFTCLRKCVSCCDPENVEVNLLLRDGHCCKRPLSLFLLKDIRNLVLSMNNAPLTIPSRYHLSTRLQNLTLNSVKIPPKSFGTLVSSERCPNLKQLHLYECGGVEYLKIQNESVEHVEIIQENWSGLSSLSLWCDNLQTLLITWYPPYSTGPQLELFVDKLEHFVWKGFPCRIYDGRLYEHIKSATFYCTSPTEKSHKESYAPVNFSLLVLNMGMTKSLRLLARTIQILFTDLRKEKSVYSLQGVETLHIDDCYLTDDEVPAIAFILKMMPELKNVHVSFSKAISHTLLEVSGFKMDYWEAQDVKFIKKLKAATLEIQKEGNATELVKYFAKHGERLKSLKVICPSAMVSAVSEQIELMKSLVGSCFIWDVQGSEA